MTDWYLAGYEKKTFPASSAIDTSLWLVQDDGTPITQDNGTQIIVQNNS